MEKYKLKDFAKWAKKEGLSDIDLNRTLNEMEQGLLGEKIGAHVYKKRIGVHGKGKRGSVRTILIYKENDVAVFLYGYSKNEKSNLTPGEQKALRIFAKAFMQLTTEERKQSVKNRALVKIKECTP